MGIDFLVSHNGKTMIKNLYDGSIKLYDTRETVKNRIEDIIGSSSIIGMTRIKSKEDEQVSKLVKFATDNSTITFEDEATTKYIDIMSELNNRRIVDTYNTAERLIETGEFNVVNLLIDDYSSEMADSSLSVIDNAIVYHITKGKGNAIEGREVKNMSEIIDKFLEVYGISGIQNAVKNYGIILGNDNKSLVSNEEHVISMVNRKVGNYGKRI